MSDTVYLSPSRLATYAACQRRYDHEYVQDIEAAEQTLLYANQGRAYHETIETVCDVTAPDDDAVDIHQRALDTFETKWAEHLDPDEYSSRAHQEYQRRETRAGIEAFFDPEDGDGIRHARQSIATEIWLECSRGDIGLHGYADNVLRTEDGLHVIDYKRNVKGIVTSYTADKYLEDHLNGEAHEPSRVKNTFQTATYLEGVKKSDLYEAGMDLRFSFYGLLHDTTFESTPTGYEVAASGRRRETTEVYESHHDTIWALIEDAHEGIRTERHEPDPLQLINEEECSNCDYREMCPEYLAQEVQR